MSAGQPDTSVVVIGAGQAGLSVSYYLRRLGLEPGVEFIVLDRGPGQGGAWQFRWDALRIGSAHRINDLPGMDELGVSFDDADRTLPAKQVVADYYGRYEEHYGLRVVRPAQVTSVTNSGTDLLVSFVQGGQTRAITTDIVINATGTWGAPFVPWYPGRDDFQGRQLHTSEYEDAFQFEGLDVIVVGGGTSAIGFLLELEGIAKSVTWTTRRDADFLPEGELTVESRRSAVELQDEAARAGRALPSIVSGTGIPRTRRIQAGIERGVLTTHEMFTRIEPDGVRYADGTFQHADVILWSTGFRPELRHLAPLKLREKEGGIVVAQGTSWKDARIFFAGYGPQASTIGANRAGRAIARQAIATLSRNSHAHDAVQSAPEAPRRGVEETFVPASAAPAGGQDAAAAGIPDAAASAPATAADGSTPAPTALDEVEALFRGGAA